MKISMLLCVSLSRNLQVTKTFTFIKKERKRLKKYPGFWKIEEGGIVWFVSHYVVEEFMTNLHYGGQMFSSTV